MREYEVYIHEIRRRTMYILADNIHEANLVADTQCIKDYSNTGLQYKILKLREITKDEEEKGE